MSAGNPRDLSDTQRALRASTAERLEAIVEAAERAAESVIDDAEAQAHRYLAETRERADREAALRLSSLSELTDSLLGEATALRHQAERLQASLEEAKARIEVERRPQPEFEPQEAPRLRAVEAVERPAFDPEAKRTDPAGARLLATQMAVSGSSREEIELRLRNGFEIEDTRAILDAILGPEE
jgi:small-conductance mechanosensitive channel